MTKSKIGKSYGWKKDKVDSRDFLHMSAMPEAALPQKVDLRSHCPAVYDQGQLGSCTANAIAGALEFDWIKEAKNAPYVPSRLFIYYNERMLEGSTDEDSGAQIRDGIKTLKMFGFAPESMWPYDVSQFAVKPSTAVYAAAKKEIVNKYARVSQSAQGLKSVLASGLPIVFGFTVYESFESQTVANTGVMPMPAAGEEILGGHAVLCVGYDSVKKVYIIRNSWGSGWGMSGYFTMPAAFLESGEYCSDFWVVDFVP